MTEMSDFDDFDDSYSPDQWDPQESLFQEHDGTVDNLCPSSVSVLAERKDICVEKGQGPYNLPPPKRNCRCNKELITTSTSKNVWRAFEGCNVCKEESLLQN